MADCSAACITIGGTIPGKAAKQHLAKAIAEEACATAWDDRRLDDEENALAAIDQAIAGNAPIALYDDTRPGGQFEPLEAVCRELVLSYVRSDDGHYTYPANVVYWRPCLEEPRVWIGECVNHEPQLGLDRLDTRGGRACAAYSSRGCW